MRNPVPVTWLVLAALVAGCADVGPVQPSADAGGLRAAVTPAAGQARLYAAIRSATAQYHDIERALADGYVQGSECVATPAGGMGYHYLRPEIIDGEVDPLSPEVLVYEPQPNRRLRLVAVEYIVVAELWNGDGIPMLGTQPFDDHTAPGSGGPPFPHYQLHAWLWQHNPDGVHAQFNPLVSCAHADDD